MNILNKLHEIEKKKCIYNIHYCKAGIGMIFFDPPDDFKEIDPLKDIWKKYLTVEKYYPTFEEMIEAEFKKL